MTEKTVPVGRVKFVLTVITSNADASHRAESVDQSWKRYRHAFISYASEDQVEVLRCVQMLKLASIDVYQDILSLQSGERWEKALYKHIEDSDVLFLFWSSAAKASEWVTKEVQYALNVHGGDDTAPPDIVPVIIEGPPPVPPPPEWERFFFNDPITYFIAGVVASKNEKREHPAQDDRV